MRDKSRERPGPSENQAILKVAPFTFYQVYKIFGVARYGVPDFSSFVGCKKSIVCLTLSKKRTGKAAWVVAFDSCRLLAGRIFVRQCRMD